MKTFTETIKLAMERTIFWHVKDGPVWVYGLSDEGSTTAGYQGTWSEIVAINSQFILDNDPRRLVPIQSAPPLAPSQRKP